MPGATPEHTHLFQQRAELSAHAVCVLGRTGLHVSRLGFGCYRVDQVTLDHAEALRYALRHGINLIDTSTNYGDGESEALVGRILRELLAAGELRREEVVVVSKAGYVQGQNLKLAQEREIAGRPFAEMVKYMEGCWHCLHPEFLQDQLARSLSRLQLERLDVLLLHNPEYFLSHARKQRLDLPGARAEYYRRIEAAFRFLEAQVAAGKIGWYGISSNTFPQASAHAEFTSLERVWEIAEKVSPQSHFGVIQFPMNLFESGAGLEKNQHQGRQTLLQCARTHGLGTLVNRPLNAMTAQAMMRLADFQMISSPEAEQIFPAQLASLSKVEEDFHQKLVPQFSLPRQRQGLAGGLYWAEQLQEGLHLFRDWGHWDYAKQYMIEPQSERALHVLRDLTGSAPAWVDWESRFRRALSSVVNTLTAFYSRRSVADNSQRWSAQLSTVVPGLKSSNTLSQKALRVLLNTNGIDAVLLGMRRTPYVADGLQALQASPLSNVESAYSLWKN